VKFTLRPGVDATIGGFARFTPLAVTCGINASGLVKANDLTNPCVVTNTTSLSPSGSYYRIDICPSFACTSSLVSYATGGSVDLSTLAPTPAQMPAYSLVDIFQNQTIGGNKTFTGNTTLGGATTISSTATYTGSTSDPTGTAGMTNYRTDLFRPRFFDGTSWHSIPGTDTADTLSGKSTAAGPLTGTVASGTAAMPTAALGSGACSSVVTVSAPGVISSDAIIMSPTSVTTPNGYLGLNSFSSTNNVNFLYCNGTAASQTPAAETLNWRVVR
jgi:hypothetical protein